MNEEVVYAPSVWQQQYHALTTTEALGAGAAGPGKTTCLLWDPVPQILVEHKRCEDKDHPFYHPWGESRGMALHLRRTFPMLDQTINEALKVFPKLDPKVHWNAQDNVFTFSSGYRYKFGHCRHETDWQGYLSQQFTYMAFDELTQFDREQYENLKLRVRTTDPVLMKMRKVRSMSNPFISRSLGGGGQGEANNFTVKDPQWVKRYFIDPAPQGGKVLKRKITLMDGSVEWHTRIYLRATLFDNPNKEYVRQYEITLQSSPPHLRDAYLHGRWDVTVGSFFGDDWDHRLHVCAPFAVPSDWPVFRSMDWGYKAPGSVGWYAIDEDDNLFKVHELTFRMKTPGDVSMMIEKYEKEHRWWKGGRSLLSGPADTQLWETRGGGFDVKMTKAAEFRGHGVSWFPADKSSRYRNAQLLSARLRDHGNGTTTPGVVFFDTCVNSIRTIPSIGTDPNDPETPQDGGDDHWLDETLYACAYASKGRKGVRKMDRPRESWEDDANPMAETRDPYWWA